MHLDARFKSHEAEQRKCLTVFTLYSATYIIARKIQNKNASSWGIYA